MATKAARTFDLASRYLASWKKKKEKKTSFPAHCRCLSSIFPSLAITPPTPTCPSQVRRPKYRTTAICSTCKNCFCEAGNLARRHLNRSNIHVAKNKAEGSIPEGWLAGWRRLARADEGQTRQGARRAASENAVLRHIAQCHAANCKNCSGKLD